MTVEKPLKNGGTACPRCGRKVSFTINTGMGSGSVCPECHQEEVEQYAMRQRLQAILTSTLPTLHMAQPSVGSHRVEHVDHTELSAKDSGYVLHFRLPRWNGKLEITDGTIADLARAGSEKEARLSEYVTKALHQAARELRGRALLELLETDWAMPPDSKKEDFQRLERALVSLIERTEK